MTSYVRVAWRSLRRQRGYAVINVGGLALGLACCLVLFQYVVSETQFDRFHENGVDLYRVATSFVTPGEEPSAGAFTPHAMAPAFAEAVPEILNVSRVHPEYNTAIVSSPARPDRVFEEAEVFYVDPAFLEMFTFPVVAGDAGALAQPGEALVSETTAQKYFGTANPVGQTLDVTGQVTRSYRVAGVFRDVPATSHLQFGLLLPMAAILEEGQYTEPESNWGYNNFATYVQLRSGSDRAEAERKMTGVLLDHIGDGLREQGRTVRVLAQPLRDIHLNAEIKGPAGPGGVIMGSRRTVTFLTLVGLVTLLIAIVNYVNLATARALDRAREVGVRKSVGAKRHQLVAQFLAESALTVLVAAMLAVVLALAVMPALTVLVGATVGGTLWASPSFWAVFAGTLVGCTLLAGLYPAAMLSAFQPAHALKGGSSGGGRRLRQVLVVLQFTASVVLIGGTAVVYEQLRYVRELDLGLDLAQVLTVDAPRVLPDGASGAENAGEVAASSFADELRRLPAVREVATSTTVPGQGFIWNGAQVRKAEDDPSSIIPGVLTKVDTSFVSVYGVKLVAGDMDAFTLPPDSTESTWTLIANETAVQALGFASPQEAIGRVVDFGGSAAVLVAVVGDFSWSSAHTKRENIFFSRSAGGDRVSLRVAAEDLPSTLAEVEAVYTRLFPGNVFTYAFADQAFDEQYRDDERFARLFTLFAGLAIVIACLGLFGLATFTAQQRRKEIGVRKVLGASVASLVGLLSRDLLVLVAVAVVVGSPLVYWLMSRWLEGFAYRVSLGPRVFLAAGATAVAVAMATVAGQAFRAASADPVQAIRPE